MSKNVLIVDDSATMRQMVRRTMVLACLDIDEVYEAANGIEGLAALAEHEIAVILLDINMPTMNGMQLLARMKSHPELKSIPIVIASTEGSEQRISELVQAGAYGYVRKPFHPEQLRDVLKPLLGVKDDGTAAAVGNSQADLF